MNDLDAELLKLTLGYIDDYYHDISTNKYVHKEHPRVSDGVVLSSSISTVLKEQIGNVRAFDVFAARVPRIQGLTFKPGRDAPRLVQAEGVRLPYLNEFRLPDHPEITDPVRATEDYLTLWRFLRRLVPEPVEWKQVVYWIAAKVFDPAVRMHGLVMVAEGTYGTGRDTLFRLLGKMIGEWNTCTVKQDSLLGATYQSQYLEDALWRSTLAYMSESSSVPEAGKGWSTKQRAYERLKEFIDTHPIMREVVRKGSHNTQRTFYTSFLLATNHGDAFPIGENDRRCIVVSNGAPLARHESKAVHAAIDNPEAVSLLSDVLSGLGRRVVEEGKYYDIYASNPLRTRAKTHMVDQSRDDVGDEVDDFLKSRTPGAFSASMFSRDIPNTILAKLHAIDPGGGRIEALRARVARCLRRRCRVALGGAKLKVGANSERIYVIGEMEVDVDDNGPKSRAYLHELLGSCRSSMNVAAKLTSGNPEGNS